jgi:hypothetical protein
VSVGQESIQVVPGRDGCSRAVAQNVGQCNQRLGGGKRPDRPVPLALAAACRAKFGGPVRRWWYRKGAEATSVKCAQATLQARSN